MRTHVRSSIYGMRDGIMIWGSLSNQISELLLFNSSYVSMETTPMCNGESLAQFENRIKPRVYVRRISCSTMYEKKAPFC